MRVHDVAPEIMSRMLPDDAAAWVHRSDEANALLVASGAAAADVVVRDGRVVTPGPPDSAGRPAEAQSEPRVEPGLSARRSRRP